MTRYIAFLRGINVGGHTVKMEYLRKLFTDLSFENVSSYIQSGNIFFDTNEKNSEHLRSSIEKHLEKHLGFSVAVCLRTVEELKKIMHIDPFKNIELTPDTRFSVTFLPEPVKQIPIPFKTPDEAYELIAMTKTELFVVWHLKNGRPGSSYGFLEKKLQTKGTTRFWHTTSKILAAATL